VRNEEVLHRVKEERNIVHTIKRRKANWIGHILRRNCLVKHVIEGKLEGRIEMTGRRGRRRKQLLDDLKERRRYWKVKEEALDRTIWRTWLWTCRKTDCVMMMIMMTMMMRMTMIPIRGFIYCGRQVTDALSFPYTALTGSGGLKFLCVLRSKISIVFLRHDSATHRVTALLFGSEISKRVKQNKSVVCVCEVLSGFDLKNSFCVFFFLNLTSCTYSLLM
jgi:hypothetical protein